MKIPKLCKNGDGRAFSIIPKTNGKRKYFGIYGTTDAERRYKEWLARLLNSDGLLYQEKKQSEYFIAELVSYYVEFTKPKMSQKRFGLVWKNLHRLLDLAGYQLGIEITPKLLIQYQQMMSKETYKTGNVVKKYKRVSVNIAIQHIKEFVKWCCKYEYLPPEHHLKLECIENLRKGDLDLVESEPVLPISFETLIKTVPYLSKIVGVMVQVQYYCGMRPGEVCSLNWKEIDQTHDVWIYVPINHKTKHRNWKLMKAVPKVAQDLILSEEYFTQGEYVFDPRIFGKNTPKENQKFSTKGYAEAVVYGCKKAIKKGVIDEAWTPNQLRHAIATDIRRLYGQEAAQDYLGHSSLSTTEIYAERTRERIIDLARRLQIHLFGGTTNGECNERDPTQNPKDEETI